MNNTLEKICLLVMRWGTYLVLFTPLIINTKFFFPFVAPKTLFFRIVVEIILTAYLLLAIANQKYRPRINAVTVSLALFLLVFILASFTGVNLSRSFWSTHERMTGIWTMLHLFALFIVLTSVFKKKEDWEKFLGVSILAGVGLSFYILQGSEISTRGGGTIGNTSFMAAYLIFDVFFALILFLANFLKKGGWPLFWQIFAGLSLIVMVPVLLDSTARGAIISFWGGLFLLGLGYLAFSQKKVLQRITWGIVLALIIFTLISVVFQPPFVTKEVKGILRDLGSRFTVWQTGWQGFLERPILGWGPENFIVVFNKYFNPCMSLPQCGSEIWFDRVHNIVFDTLVTTGLVGLLSYLSVFIVVIGGLLRLVPKIVERRNIFIPLGIAVLLIVYFFQNLLVFDMINTYLMFFLTLGLASFLTQKQSEEKEIIIKPFNYFLGAIVVVVMISVLWLGNVKPAQSGYFIVKTMSSREINEASAFFQRSLDSWMEKYEPREYFAQKMAKAGYQQIAAEDKPAFRQAFVLAEIEMEKSIKDNPLDFRPHLFLGELYNASYRLEGDTEKLKRAEEVSEKAVELSPTNQQGYWNLAETKLALGKTDEVIPLLRKAVELEAEVGLAHWYLAMGYRIFGQNQLAKEEIIKAGERGFNWKSDLENLKRAIDIYATLKDDAGLVVLYLRAIELDSTNAQFWALLAASYANLGEFQKAREAAEKVKELNPDLIPQIEEFLKSLP